jgi:hypothetical protein
VEARPRRGNVKASFKRRAAAKIIQTLREPLCALPHIKTVVGRTFKALNETDRSQAGRS